MYIFLSCLIFHNLKIILWARTNRFVSSEFECFIMMNPKFSSCFFILDMLGSPILSSLKAFSKFGLSSFHTSPVCNEIRLLARLRCVDNSEIGKKAMLEGKPPKTIHVYNKTHVGYLGDKVLVAVKGQKKKGILVGLKQKQKIKIPKFDTNNVSDVE